MKALSIKQPWASLIAHGIKDIENRTWKTHFRGRIYIHASAKWVGKLNKDDETYGGIYSDEQWDYIRKNYPLFLESLLQRKTTNHQLKVSAIIGEVDIIDCVINHCSIWAESTATTQDGKEIVEKPIYNWVLANPVLYDKPILNVKGKLSFWEFEPNKICDHPKSKRTYIGQNMLRCNLCGKEFS